MKKDHPYWPLIASLLVLPWALVAFLGLIFSVGDTPYENTPGKAAGLGLIAAIPAIAGLVYGAMRIVRGAARTTAQQTWLWIGTVLCGLWSYGLTIGFIH